MKKKLESILANTQIHKIEAAAKAKTEETMPKTEVTEPVAEIETEPAAEIETEPVAEIKTEPLASTEEIPTESMPKTEEIKTEPVAEIETISVPAPEHVKEPEHVEELEPEPKFAPPTSLISWDGDLMQKIKIFNRCADNGIITNIDATGLKEKSIILDRIIPKIIVDESVASSNLFEGIKQQGYDGMYLGKDSPDDIFRIAGGNVVLVIEEAEFYAKIGDSKVKHVPIFVSRGAAMVDENVGVIVNHMQLFEKIRK